MANKTVRELLEMQNVFADPKYSRQAWKAVGSAILQNPAAIPIEQRDKDGNVTFASQLEQYSYEKLAKDLKELGKDARLPTELEVIMQCQILKARYDTGAAVFVRDTLGAKPVDESKVQADVTNIYEHLTDEELELLARHRDAMAAAQTEQADNDTVRQDTTDES